MEGTGRKPPVGMAALKSQYGRVRNADQIPTFVAPIHAHTGLYGVNLTGIWRHSFDGGEQKDMPPGSYVFQPGMGWHGDACIGPDDCILFIHQHVKGDFIPKQ
jgi:hypothetical protein